MKDGFAEMIIDRDGIRYRKSSEFRRCVGLAIGWPELIRADGSDGESYTLSMEPLMEDVRKLEDWMKLSDEYVAEHPNLVQGSWEKVLKTIEKGACAFYRQCRGPSLMFMPNSEDRRSQMELDDPDYIRSTIFHIASVTFAKMAIDKGWTVYMVSEAFYMDECPFCRSKGYMEISDGRFRCSGCGAETSETEALMACFENMAEHQLRCRYEQPIGAYEMESSVMEVLDRRKYIPEGGPHWLDGYESFVAVVPGNEHFAHMTVEGESFPQAIGDGLIDLICQYSKLAGSGNPKRKNDAQRLLAIIDDGMDELVNAVLEYRGSPSLLMVPDDTDLYGTVDRTVMKYQADFMEKLRIEATQKGWDVIATDIPSGAPCCPRCGASLYKIPNRAVNLLKCRGCGLVWLHSDVAVSILCDRCFRYLAAEPLKPAEFGSSMTVSI